PFQPYCNDFRRDLYRVIHSRAFCRLEAKTQVFTRRYSDHFRNRLTHTIEVAQIARTIALQLGLNEDLVEALALVHDVGHPPFGHAGEKALDAAMRAHGPFFDHNLHALRMVEGICEGLPVVARFYREAERTYPNVMEKLKFNEALKRLLDHMVGDLIRNTEKQIRSAAIKSLEDVRACPHRLSMFSSGVEKERSETKK